MNEISFINALNEKDLADQLNQKLLETETRINNARERRRAAQTRANNKNETRRANNSKALNERDVVREEQQQLRLEMLQTRMTAVSERRAERMKEAEVSERSGGGVDEDEKYIRASDSNTSHY